MTAHYNSPEAPVQPSDINHVLDKQLRLRLSGVIRARLLWTKLTDKITLVCLYLTSSQDGFVQSLVNHMQV